MVFEKRANDTLLVAGMFLLAQCSIILAKKHSIGNTGFVLKFMEVFNMDNLLLISDSAAKSEF